MTPYAKRRNRATYSPEFHDGRGRDRRRRLAHEPLEARLTLDGSGLPGNECPPDLNLSAVVVQSARVGEERVLDLLGSGGTVMDLDADGNPTGDTIRFLLDPDDTPAGATITSGGVFRWTPTMDQVGSFDFVVLAVDSGTPPLADAEVFVVNVIGNTAPNLADIADATVGVGEMLEVTVTASDADGDTLTFMLDRDDPNSTLPDDAVLEQTNNTTAVIRWTPDVADAGQSLVFSVIVTDDGSPPTADREQFTVNVISVAAANDSYSVAVDGDLTVDAASGVLANDMDSGGDTLTAVVVTNPTSGTLTLAADGSFTYTPNAGFQGTDTFTYRAEDGTGDADEAVVTIQVNAGPAAVDDTYTVGEDMTLTIDAAAGVLDNDTDPDGDMLTAMLVGDVANGTLTLAADGSFTYVPDENFSGTDSFTYHATDGIIESGEATVTITVTAANDLPATVADDYSVDENATLSVDAAGGVLANDTDADADPLTATLGQAATNGTVTLNDNGSFTYMPNAGFEGTDTFTYVANDGTADSAATTVTITVSAVNAPPQAVADTYATTEGNALTVNAAAGVLANDTDADADTLMAALVDNVTNGTLTLNTDGSFTYTPNADFTGEDSFTYTANDGTATTAATQVTIEVAEQNAFSVAENSPAGTVVGQVVPEGQLGPTVVFTIDDPNLDAALELAADDHVTGNPAGSVVLIEYVDFQCPICRSYNPIVEELIADFPDDLMVVTRHYPLPPNIHRNAFNAAVATEAAGRQGMFDEYGDLLFDRQDEWGAVVTPQSLFDGYATQLGLNLADFQAAVADPVIALRIQRDVSAVMALGGTGTPTFFLQGERLTSNPSEDDFAPLIQAAVEAVTDPFTVNRQTGEILVRDPASLDFETTPSLTLNVNAIGLTASEQIAATIDLVDVSEAQAAPATALPVLDAAFAEDVDWLDPMSTSR
jgi:VCBS repeat-containing protein